MSHTNETRRSLISATAVTDKLIRIISVADSYIVKDENLQDLVILQGVISEMRLLYAFSRIIGSAKKKYLLDWKIFLIAYYSPD